MAVSIAGMISEKDYILAPRTAFKNATIMTDK